MGALDVWICMDLHHLRVPGGCGNCRGCGCILGSGFRSKLWSFKEKVRDSFRSYLHHRRTGRCRCFDLELSPILFHLWPVQAICGLEDCHQFGWTRRMWRQDVTMDNTGWGTQRCTWPACWFTSHPCRWGPWVQEELIFRIFVGNKMKHENMKRTKGKTWKITKDHEIVHKSLPGLSGLSSLKKSENSCFFGNKNAFALKRSTFCVFLFEVAVLRCRTSCSLGKHPKKKHERVTRESRENIRNDTPKHRNHGVTGPAWLFDQIRASRANHYAGISVGAWNMMKSSQWKSCWRLSSLRLAAIQNRSVEACLFHRCVEAWCWIAGVELEKAHWWIRRWHPHWSSQAWDSAVCRGWQENKWPHALHTDPPAWRRKLLWRCETEARKKIAGHATLSPSPCSDAMISLEICLLS